MLRSDDVFGCVCCLLQIPVLLLNNVIEGKTWTKVDVNIGKIAELYGD
jgi:hypothetical protein